MALESKEYDPILSLVHSLDVTGKMRAKGQSYKWCRGMVFHYINQMQDAGISEDRAVEIGQSLMPDTRQLIREIIDIDGGKDYIRNDTIMYLLALVGVHSFTSLSGRTYLCLGSRAKN